MNTVNEAVESCSNCPFMEYSFNRSKELGFGNRRGILFIGMAPAINSNKSQGFSKFDMFFGKLLSEVNIKFKDYYFTNLVKTSIPKDVVLTPEETEHCLTHLRNEIEYVNPDVIIPMGKITREAFGLKWPEKPYRKVIKGKQYIFYPLAHPGTLYYKPELKEEYMKKLNKAITYYKPKLL